MARKIGVAGKEISTDTGGSYAPLPAGNYEATIFSVKEDVYKGANSSGIPYLNVQFRISEGQKGANRRIFDKIPLETAWKDGKDAFRFFQFGAAVNGMDEKEFRKATKAAAEKKGGAVEIPDDADLLGAGVTLVLGIEDDKYHFDKAHEKWEDLNDPDAPEPKIADYQQNNVKNILVPGKGNMGSDSNSGEDVSSAVTLEEFEL